MKVVGPIKSRNLGKENSWKVRMLYCAYYDQCLNIAAENMWPAFSCIQCQFWDEKKRTINIGDNQKEIFYDQRRGD